MFQLAFVFCNKGVQGQRSHAHDSSEQDAFLDIPNDQIILIWEHSCIKHIEKGEIQRAREVKETMDWQRDNKKFLTIGQDEMLEFQQHLKEAQAAKAKAGEKWGCDGIEPEEKIVKKSLVIYEIKTPSPDSSFISTDALQFHAKIKGAPELDKKISWVSEDGKASSVDSGVLDPAALKWSADYPSTAPLKPNPPEAPEGRKGKLSYKITASIRAEDAQETTAVLIQQDELDQLRQEYVDIKKVRVPQREEFVQNGGKFNTGDYAWAVVIPKMLDGYRTVAENYSPHPARINSAYRNPSLNLRIGGEKESRHIYGDAVDIQTVAIGHKGGPNYEDWKFLYDIAEKANPSYIEEFEKSKAGHVHADWGPKRGRLP